MTTYDEKNSELLLKTFSILLENSHDMIFIKDLNLNYVAASKSMLNLVGLNSADELIGKSDYSIFSAELAKRYTIDDRGILESGRQIVDYLEPLPDIDGRKLYSSTSKFVIRGDDGKAIGLLGIGRDVTSQIELLEARQRSAMLEIQADTDALTGLLNRESVMRKVREQITGDAATQSHALLFIDLDCFKQVNDTLGHPFGDRILREISIKLKALCGEHDIAGRIGGDEFLVLIRDFANKTEVQYKANALCQSLPLQLRGDDHTISITCSVGVSFYNGDGKSLEQLYEEADKAMYVAKANGRNSISYFE